MNCESTSAFSFSPQVGYVVIDNLFIDLDSTFYFKNRDDSLSETSSNTYPMVRDPFGTSTGFSLFL